MALKLFLLAVELLMAGMGVLLFRKGLTLRRLGRASLQWPQAQGRVTAIKIRANTTTDNDGNMHTLYEPLATYDFEVAGRVLSGTRISFRDLQQAQSRAQDVAERYPVGADVSVAYDPEDPTINVLETGFSGFNWNIFNAAVCLVAAVLMFVFTLKYL